MARKKHNCDKRPIHNSATRKSYFASANPANEAKIKAVSKLIPTTVMVLRAAVPSE